ncbi:MAG: NAD-dependent epimerase/dehydratase family protein, partial [Bulleidia sp.]
LIRKAYQNDPFEMWIDGDSIRDYFYITDLAQAIRLLIQKEISREIINVGSGIGTSLNEVIHLAEAATGHPIHIVPKSSDVPVVRAIVLDISKLERLTGYQPSVSMQEGIAMENERIRGELGL